MSKTRPKENDRFGWSAFSTKLKLLTIAVLGLTILMSTAHSLGIDTGDGQRGDDLVSGLLGQGEVRSVIWLWIARLSVVGIVITVIMMGKEERRIAAQRRERERLRETSADMTTEDRPGQ